MAKIRPLIFADTRHGLTCVNLDTKAKAVFASADVKVEKKFRDLWPSRCRRWKERSPGSGGTGTEAVSVGATLPGASAAERWDPRAVGERREGLIF